ncbi:MAG: class I SAM-dependent methyltransferase, partial [Thermoplasmata archaeon]|nr:class I SAM-dependent methyltransferase [Thermoplasmata archaeon]
MAERNRSMPPTGSGSRVIGSLQRGLRTPFAWRLSGWTYPTAVLATVGRVLTPDGYLRLAAAQMARLRPWIPPAARVLELGSGLGGNLQALHRQVRSGVG